jgi:CubicO group peptidase (beta-lactamase class C family)
VQRLRTPCAIAPFYGALTWLNPDGRVFPGASAAAFFMVGAGGHLVWIEPAHDAVVVARWLDPAHTAGFTQRMGEALRHA